jgi:hypothetical protein
MATLIRCTCCQAELSAPQFYNGFPYGYTCIKKVDPTQKKSKIVYLAMEAFKLVSDPSGSRHVVNVKYQGKWQQIVCYSGSIESKTSSTFMQDGVLFVAETIIKK